MHKGYAVMDENTLGYRFDMEGKEYMGILHASVLRGSIYDRLSGPIQTSGRVMRRATAQDFDAFRVTLPPGFKEVG